MVDDQTSKNYRSFIEEKHSKWNTEISFIDQVVKRATGSNLLESKRIISGEVNEVYSIITADRQDVIVRISHNKDFRFQAEKWAIDKSLEQGVPAPKILLVEDFVSLGRSICVENKIDGEPLISKLDKGEGYVRKIVKDAGLILSKIHQVKTTGFGHLNKDGKGVNASWSEYILKITKDRASVIKAAKRLEFDPNVIDRAMKILIENKSLFEVAEPRLIHGDYGPKHFLISGSEIVGIIDFENCKSGDPVFDFAWWDFFRGSELPLEWLKEGYSNKELFDSQFELKLHLYKIYLGLTMLRYYEGEQNLGGINHTKEQLKRDLKFFNTEQK